MICITEKYKTTDKLLLIWVEPDLGLDVVELATFNSCISLSVVNNRERTKLSIVVQIEADEP